MFREMRKQDRKMTEEEAIDLLIRGEYGILSTTDQNGYAYGVPLSYVYSERSILFHSATVGHKLDNINNNEKVSFCVVGNTEIIPEKFTTKFESVIVFGRVTILEGEDKKRGLLALVEKYSKDFLEKGKAYIDSDMILTTVFKVDIEHFSGKQRK